jgi:hypothetical protein
MSWIATIGVALVGALTGAAASFVLALYGRWLHDKDGSALFFLPLLGLVGGAVIGALVARHAADALHHSFPRTLAAAAVAVLAAVAAEGVATRALADVPPTRDGGWLRLAVEVRWPAAQRERPPAPLGHPGLRFGRAVRGGLAAPADGALWTGAPRRDVSGRWVAPGAVAISTERGPRALDVVLDGAREGETTHRFVLPLPRRPGAADAAWSAWIAAAASPAGAGAVQVRYRVEPLGELAHTEHVGAFAVDVLTRPHAAVRHVLHWTERRVRHPALAGAWSAVHLVALVPSARPALLVRRDGETADVWLLVDEGDRVRTQRLASLPSGAPTAFPLTNDEARRRAAGQHLARTDGVDRALLAQPGRYLVGDVVLDTRTLAVSRVPSEGSVEVSPWLPPLVVSPDGRSIVQFADRPPGAVEPTGPPTLHVADVVGGRAYVLPIDTARTPFADVGELTPAWVARHFAWARDAAGVDRLVPRLAR